MGEKEEELCTEETMHMIVYTWCHYYVTMDDLAELYGLRWYDVYELIKKAPAYMLWVKPKGFKEPGKGEEDW